MRKKLSLALLVGLLVPAAAYGVEWWYYGDKLPDDGAYGCARLMPCESASGTLNVTIVDDEGAWTGGGKALKIEKAGDRIVKFVKSFEDMIDPVRGATLVVRCRIPDVNSTASSAARNWTIQDYDAAAPDDQHYYTNPGLLYAGTGGTPVIEKEFHGIASKTTNGAYEIANEALPPMYVYRIIRVNFWKQDNTLKLRQWVDEKPMEGMLDRDGYAGASDSTARPFTDSVAFGSWSKDYERIDKDACNDGYTQTLYIDYVYFSNDGHYGPGDAHGIPYRVVWHSETTSPDGTQVEVGWGNGAATTGYVDYRLVGQTAWTTVPDDSNPQYIMDHFVTLAGLTAESVYEFRVRGETLDGAAGSSGVMRFTTYAVPGTTIKNGGFEAQILGNAWTAFVGSDKVDDWMYFYGEWGIPRPPGNDQGNWFAAAISSSDAAPPDLSGMYQKVLTVPDSLCMVTARVFSYANGGVSTDVGCRLGIDFTGGTDATASTVVWGEWVSTQGVWADTQVGGKAVGAEATVFLQAYQPFGLALCVSAFDNVAFQSGGTAPTTVSGVKTLGNGFPVDLPGDKIVTAAWPTQGRLYIEEADRSSGIKVESDAIPLVGSLVAVAGTVGTTSDGERFIRAQTVTPGDPAEVPGALGMTNRQLGGGRFGLQVGMSDTGAGTNTVGLLCRIWGKVLPKPGSTTDCEYQASSEPGDPNYDPYGRYYIYITDDAFGSWSGGSGPGDPFVWYGAGVVADYILIGGGANPWENLGNYRGVRVYLSPSLQGQFEPGLYLTCTGVSGVERSDSNWTDPGGTVIYTRTLEVRDVNDIEFAQ